MEPFVTHSGRAATLRWSGCPESLTAWRGDPGRVLGPAGFAGATILVAGPQFAAGPGPASAEGGARALAGHGFLVVISVEFGEIFANSMTKCGLHPVCLPIGKVSELQDIVHAYPETLFSVDLGNREVAAGNKFSAVFEIVGLAHLPPRGGRAGGARTASRSSDIGVADGDCTARLPVAGSAQMAGRIRAAQHRISSLDVPSDVRIQLQRRLVAMCDAMKVAAADPARWERRLALLAAELDRLAPTFRTGNSPDHFS